MTVLTFAFFGPPFGASVMFVYEAAREAIVAGPRFGLGTYAEIMVAAWLMSYEVAGLSALLAGMVAVYLQARHGGWTYFAIILVGAILASPLAFFLMHLTANPGLIARFDLGLWWLFWMPFLGSLSAVFCTWICRGLSLSSRPTR